MLELLKGSCIGFAGKLYSGKTTLANSLKYYLDKNLTKKIPIEIHSFADPLREITSKILDVDIKKYKHDFNYVTEFEKCQAYINILYHCRNNNLIFDSTSFSDLLNKVINYDDLYRLTLQYIGTELYRNQVNNDYWVERFKEYIQPDRLIITDDCRFMNEIKLINPCGISVYVVMKQDIIEVDDSYKIHASETSVCEKDCDVKYLNVINKKIESDEELEKIGEDVLWVILNALDIKRDRMREYGPM